MTSEISLETFNTTKGSTYDLVLENSTFPLELTEIEVNAKIYKDGYEVFALLFKSDKTEMDGQGPFEQMTMTLKHETLGDLHIFMTPVQTMEDGHLYEAVFNRPKVG